MNLYKVVITADNQCDKQINAIAKNEEECEKYSRAYAHDIDLCSRAPIEFVECTFISVLKDHEIETLLKLTDTLDFRSTE